MELREAIEQSAVITARAHQQKPARTQEEAEVHSNVLPVARGCLQWR
jgi:hypothetical protein